MSWAPRLWSWSKRNRVFAAILTVAFLIVIAETVVATELILRSHREANRAQESELLATRRAQEAIRGMSGVRGAREHETRQLYLGNMRLIGEFWQREDVSPRAIAELLAEHATPARPGDPDLRELAWRVHWTRLHGSAPTLYTLVGRRMAALTAEHRVATLDGRGLRVFDAQTGRTVLESDIIRPAARCTAIAPNGKFALRGDREAITVFDTSNARAQYIGSPDWDALDVEFSADGKRFAALCSDQRIRLYDPKTARETASVGVRGIAFLSLAVTSDGNTAVLTNHPGPGEVTAYSFAEQSARELKGHPTTVTTSTCSPDGTLLASGDAYGGVIVWNLKDGTIAVPRTQVFPARLRRLAFAPDGEHLAGGGVDGYLAHWPVRHPEQRVLLRGHIAELADLNYLVGDSNVLLSADNNGTVNIWDLRQPSSLVLLGDPAAPVGSVALDQQGTWLATASRKVEIWDVRRRSRLHAFDLPSDETSEKSPARKVALAPDHSLLAVGDDHSRVIVLDPVSGKPAWTTGPQANASPVSCLAFSPDGSLLAAGFGDVAHIVPDYGQRVRLWDARTGAERGTLKVNNTVSGLDFSANGRELLVACHDRKVRTWNVNDRAGTSATELEFDAAVTALDLSSDEAFLAVGLEDGGIIVRNRRTTRQLQRVNAHATPVHRVVLTRDHRSLVSISLQDAQARFWEAGGLQPTLTLGLSRANYDLTISSKGDLLVLGTAEGAWLIPALCVDEIDRDMAASRRLDFGIAGGARTP